MDSSSIIWSTRTSLLRFQKDLPKVVQVQDGYYDANEYMTLSNEEVLTLHMRKNLRTYIAFSRRGEEIRIPTTIIAKAETVTNENAKIYNTIEDMVKDGVEKVEWIHDAPWLNVEKGDIMQINELEDKCRTQSATMSFMNKNQGDIQVPLNYRSVFKPVTSKTIWLGPGQEEQLQFPITIKLIDESLKINDENTSETIDLSPIVDLGEIKLCGFQETEVFVASIKDEDNRIIVLKIPTTLDITVREGVGIIDDEYTYVSVCHQFNQRARLEQLDDACLDTIRVGNIEAALERIYEVPDSEDESHEYIEPAPAIPSRLGREPLRSQGSDDVNHGYDDDDDVDDDDDDEDYEECDINDNSPNHPSQGERDQESIREDNERVNDRGENQVIPDPPEDIQTVCCCFRSKTIKSQTYTVAHSKRSDPTVVHNRQSLRYAFQPQDRQTLDNQVKEKDFRIPKDLRHLSLDEVLVCLKYLNMDKHLDTFKNSQIDGQLLVALNEAMLEELGINSPFEKRKLMKFIHEGWRPEFHCSDT